jgi:hypothetical protein
VLFGGKGIIRDVAYGVEPSPPRLVRRTRLVCLVRLWRLRLVRRARCELFLLAIKSGKYIIYIANIIYSIIS